MFLIDVPICKPYTKIRTISIESYFNLRMHFVNQQGAYEINYQPMRAKQSSSQLKLNSIDIANKYLD